MSLFNIHLFHGFGEMALESNLDLKYQRFYVCVMMCLVLNTEPFLTDLVYFLIR